MYKCLHMCLEFTGGNTHCWAVSFKNYMKKKMDDNKENDNKINRRLCKVNNKKLQAGAGRKVSAFVTQI